MGKWRNSGYTLVHWSRQLWGAHTHTHVSLWKRRNGTDSKSSTQCSVHTIAPCSVHCHQSSLLQQLSTEISLVSIFVHSKQYYTQFWFSRHFYFVLLFGGWHHSFPIYFVSSFKVLAVANSQQMSKSLASSSYSTMQCGVTTFFQHDIWRQQPCLFF